MKRIITVLLIVTVVASTLGTHVYAANQSRSPLEIAHDYPSPDVPDPVAPNDSHIAHAQGRANDLYSQMQAQEVKNRNQARGRLVSKATKFRKVVRNPEVSGWSKSIAQRSVAINSRSAIAYQNAREGNLTEKEIRREASKIRKKVVNYKKQISYHGNSISDTVVINGEIEISLISAERWLDQVPEILNREELTKPKRLAYAAGALEGAEGNLNDAQLLHQQYRKELHGAPEQKVILENRYVTIHQSVQENVESLSYSEDLYASDMLQKARAYLHRAEVHQHDGYTAAAIINLLHAQQYVIAAEATSNVAAPGSVSGQVSEQDVYNAKVKAVKILNSTLERTNDKIVLSLLDHAERNMVGGDEDVAWVLEYPDKKAQQQAYARYIVARSLAESAKNTAALLQEPNGS